MIKIWVQRRTPKTAIKPKKTQTTTNTNVSSRLTTIIKLQFPHGFSDVVILKKECVECGRPPTKTEKKQMSRGTERQ